MMDVVNKQHQISAELWHSPEVETALEQNIVVVHHLNEFNSIIMA